MDVLLGNMREEILREQSFVDPSSKGIQMLRCLTFTNIYPSCKKRTKKNPENLVLEQCQQSFSVEQMASFQVLIDMIYWHSSFKMGPLITRYKSRPIITPLLGVRVRTPQLHIYLKRPFYRGPISPHFSQQWGRSWWNFTHQVAQGILRVCDDDEIGTCTTLGRKQCINS